MAKITTKSKLPKWRFRRRQVDSTPLLSVWQLSGSTYKFLTGHWQMLGWLTLIYGLLYFLFVRAVPQVDIGDYQSTIDELIGEGSTAIKNLTLAGLALASVGSGASQIKLIYGLVLLAVFSLAYIWSIRHITAAKRFNWRDSLYRSQTPLVPYLLLILLMSVQLLPLVIGSLLYSIVTANNIAVGPWENLLFLAIWIGLSLVSLYWLVNSLMASYAVTLPGMYPMAALAATRKLVKGRRWALLKKIIWWPIVLFLLFALVFLFLVAVHPDAAYWFYDLSLILLLPLIHSYYYQLYRSLV